MTGATVVAWGTERAADALREATDCQVATATEAPPWENLAPDCVVVEPGPETVDAVRETYPGCSLVTVGEAADDRVASLLRNGVDDHVPTGDAGTGELAARVERVVRSQTPDGSSPGAPSRPDERPPVESPERYARLLEALDAAVYVLDPGGTCTFVNDELCSLTGYERNELIGESPRRVVAAEAADRIEAAMIERLKETTDSVTITTDVPIRPKDGAPVPCDAHVTILRDDAGEITGIVGMLRDVSDRERRQELLTHLQETSHSLMQAPTREAVAEIVADAALETLGFDHCCVRLFDADERILEPVAVSDATAQGMGDRPRYTLEEGPPGAVFSTGEPAIYEDVDEIDDDHDRSPLQSAMYLPIGVHGILSLGAMSPDTFGDLEHRIAELLATNAAAACNRAKREQEVRDAREHVATIVDRIEGLVEDTVEELVAATTREEVERGVCERLAATEPYTDVWIARPDVRESTLEPVERAGRRPDAFADAAIPVDGDTPGAEAYRVGQPRVVAADTLAAAEDGWLATAAGAGIESVVAIPLAHREGSHGVLFVCSDQTAAVDDRELVVLEALGRAVADAIDAIESGRILETDEVIELSISVEGGTLLDRVAAATGASLASAGTMSGDEGQLRLFLTATGADPGDVADALAEDDAVPSATLVADLEEEALFDVALADSLVTDLVDRGAVPRRIVAEGGVTRLTLEVPDDRAARETFSFVEDRHSGATLVGYREHERPVRTRQEIRASLAERFTDRQETALRTAYHGGFFDWPRGADGDELAQSMDISRPTYHQHLRAAQRKVFEELFEATTNSDD